MQVRHAYGADAINFVADGQVLKGDGSGQTIAIVDAYHNSYLASELRLFDAKYHLPNPTINQVNLGSGQTNLGWAGEQALDAEWAHAMAPGATLDVVEAASDSTPDMMAAVDVARHLPGVSVVSMSWGDSELAMSWTYNEMSYDPIFTTPTGHTGVTFVAASGDDGTLLGANYPAASPNVVSVGGTTLKVNAHGTILSETAWNWSGGGNSSFEPEPSYQASVQHSGYRSTPDVSMEANPYPGVSVVVINPKKGTKRWEILGGTSLSAQLFGGLIAIVNQGRALAGSKSLDGPSQTLPALYSAPPSSYHDISMRINRYNAIKGYDPATGLGAPRAASLLAYLVNYTQVSKVVISSINPHITRTNMLDRAQLLQRRFLPPRNGSIRPQASRGQTEFQVNLSRVGKGRPAGSIELRVSPSPSKIPYGGFSPVRLQMDRQKRPSTTSRGLSAVHIRPTAPSYTPPQLQLPGIRDPRGDYPF